MEEQLLHSLYDYFYVVGPGLLTAIKRTIPVATAMDAIATRRVVQHIRQIGLLFWHVSGTGMMK